MTDIVPHPAAPIYRLQDGSLVVEIDEDTFQIVEGKNAGKIIRRVRETLDQRRQS